MEAPAFDESSLNADEQQTVAMLRQVVNDTLTPLFNERWPEFMTALAPEIERHLLEATRESDEQLPKLIAALIADALKPIKGRLDRIEAALFRIKP